MSTLLTPAARGEALEAIALSGPAAAKFTGISAKSLERHSAAGEALGRVKVGRRVIYLKAALESWLREKSKPVATSRTH